MNICTTRRATGRNAAIDRMIPYAPVLRDANFFLCLPPELHLLICPAGQCFFSQTSRLRSTTFRDTGSQPSKKHGRQRLYGGARGSGIWGYCEKAHSHTRLFRYFCSALVTRSQYDLVGFCDKRRYGGMQSYPTLMRVFFFCIIGMVGGLSLLALMTSGNWQTFFFLFFCAVEIIENFPNHRILLLISVRNLII